MNTITINGKEYGVKYSIRAMFIFEQIKGEPFGLYTTLDNVIYFYSMILAADKDCGLKWDEFLDAIDNDPTIVTQLMQILTDKDNNIFPKDENTDNDDEKKS